MSTEKNYLPFALREIRTAIAGGKGGLTVAQILISSMGLGHQQGESILGDLAIQLDVSVNASRHMMRLGWLGKGYINERPLPLGLFNNTSYDLASTWRFPKRYRLYPGESLRAIMTPEFNTVAQNLPIVFNGVRVKDDKPVLLYGLSVGQVIGAAGVAAPIVGDGLKCPTDSPVDIYSVAVHENNPDRVKANNKFALQIFGPDGREWFQQAEYVAVGGLPRATWPVDEYISHSTSYITLGESNGWYMGSDDTLLVEITDGQGGNFSARVTLRGSMIADVPAWKGVGHGR